MYKPASAPPPKEKRLINPTKIVSQRIRPRNLIRARAVGSSLRTLMVLTLFASVSLLGVRRYPPIGMKLRQQQSEQPKTFAQDLVICIPILLPFNAFAIEPARFEADGIGRKDKIAHG